jgi:hypothetical protein
MLLRLIVEDEIVRLHSVVLSWNVSLGDSLRGNPSLVQVLDIPAIFKPQMLWKFYEVHDASSDHQDRQHAFCSLSAPSHSEAFTLTQIFDHRSITRSAASLMVLQDHPCLVLCCAVALSELNDSSATPNRPASACCWLLSDGLLLGFHSLKC